MVMMNVKVFGEREREIFFFSRADGRAKERVFPERLEGEPAEILREKANLFI